MGVPQTGLAPRSTAKASELHPPHPGTLAQPPFSPSRMPLGPSPGFPMAPSPNGPLLLTELVEDVQQLMGHNAAGSAKVHSSREQGLVLPSESFQVFGPNSPTISRIHHSS